jgi:hypothetical protein
MLYDNQNDPDETQNLAKMPEYKALHKSLERQLKRHMSRRK